MSETDHALDAHRCPNGHLTYPGHTLCPECGEKQVETVDLSTETGEIVTWTTSTATPPGVRQPNHLAIVEFEVDGEPVRALGQLEVSETNEDGVAEVSIGDAVEPVYVPQVRDPDAGIRHPDSQEWDGFRFEPVE